MYFTQIIQMIDAKFEFTTNISNESLDFFFQVIWHQGHNVSMQEWQSK
jgi:hypothetical protein